MQKVVKLWNLMKLKVHNGRGRLIMKNIRDKDNIEIVQKRKKTTCPIGLLKSQEQINSELCLKLLRGYYQCY
ncbi:hypothetical protein LOR37_03370 [Clostridium estertheticum]|uniref:hypothetical protein n=1 Tax=Clostridium estertheticum TaxID=238834 RepID=UPI0022DD8C2F|nr:hypothetical protein [Clostridium estertheticum]WBL47743.1 hypothetical protein LOR37_03370 [Clostridium estertheticum]